MSKQAEYTEEYKDYKIEIFQDESHDNPSDWGDDEVFLLFEHRNFTVKTKEYNAQDVFKYSQIKREIKELKLTKPIVGDVYNEDEINERLEEWEEELEDLEDELNGYFDYDSEFYIFNISAYIHSGISLSLSNDTYPFNDRWDTSNTGFILVKKFFTQFNSGTQVEDVEATQEQAYDRAKGLIETWNDYLSGNIWGYIVSKKKAYYKIPKSKLDLLTDKFESIYSEFLKNQDIEEEWNEVDSIGGFYGDYEKVALLAAREVIDALIDE